MSERVRLEEGGLVFRTYEPSDQEQVWSLHRQGLEDTGAFYPDTRPEFEEDLRRIDEAYLGAGCHFWVVEAGDKIIGMTAIVRESRETARLRRMRVAREWRGRGLGQRLLEIAEQFCRRQGYRCIVLDTTDRQQAAQLLYEKNGYVRTGDRPLGGMRILYYRKELE